MSTVKFDYIIIIYKKIMHKMYAYFNLHKKYNYFRKKYFNKHLKLLN